MRLLFFITYKKSLCCWSTVVSKYMVCITSNGKHLVMSKSQCQNHVTVGSIYPICYMRKARKMSRSLIYSSCSTKSTITQKFQLFLPSYIFMTHIALAFVTYNGQNSTLLKWPLLQIDYNGCVVVNQNAPHY